MNEDRFITLAELSERTSTSPRLIRDWVHAIESPIPAYRIGGRLLFRWAEVVKWIEGHRVCPPDVDDLVDQVLKEMQK